MSPRRTPRAGLVTVVVAALTFGGQPLAAQRSVLTAGGSLELDSATNAAVLAELDRASGRGLPTAPLLAKVREGRLKRAPGPRIRQAVIALATRLDSARVALGPGVSADDLVAGADALAAGAGPDALRAVRSATDASSVAIPLGALAQLVASGVPARRATGMIVELLRHRATPIQLVAFGNAVESDVASGLPGDEAATFRLRAASAATGFTDRVMLNSAPAITPGSPASSPSSPRRRP